MVCVPRSTLKELQNLTRVQSPNRHRPRHHAAEMQTSKTQLPLATEYVSLASL